VQGAGCRVQGAGCRVQGAGCRVQGAGCRVSKALSDGGDRGGDGHVMRGSESGSYFRLMDVVYHSTLGLSVIKRRERPARRRGRSAVGRTTAASRHGLVHHALVLPDDLQRERSLLTIYWSEST